MANGNGKELRISLDPDIHAAIVAAAKARGVTPARLMTDAWMTFADILPRMTDAMQALEAARRDGDRIGVIRDYIADESVRRSRADDEADRPVPSADFQF